MEIGRRTNERRLLTMILMPAKQGLKAPAVGPGAVLRCIRQLWAGFCNLCAMARIAPINHAPPMRTPQMMTNWRKLSMGFK
jgi:hypothetical protein